MPSTCVPLKNGMKITAGHRTMKYYATGIRYLSKAMLKLATYCDSRGYGTL